MTNLGNTYVSDAAPRWTVEAIGRLRELAVEGVPAAPSPRLRPAAEPADRVERTGS